MVEIATAVIVGIVSGVLTGLAPGIPIVLGYFLFLPLIDPTPLPLLCYAMLSVMGTQFFGSQAALYYRIPGETSSFPILFEIKNFNSAGEIYQAVQTTTYGSLVASLFASGLLTLTLMFGLLQGLTLPILAKFSIFLFLIVVAITGDRRWVVNTLTILFCSLISYYEDVAPVIGAPVYYFNSLLALIIIVSFQLTFKNLETINYTQIGNIEKQPFPIKKWIVPFSAYSLIGSIFGFMPQLGATVSSYACYFYEKFRGHSPLVRVAASETANNSAIITAWLPLLVFGIPITATEVLFVQYFNQLGFNFEFMKETSNQLTLFSVLAIATMIYSVMALSTNKLMYKWIAIILSNRWFGLIVGTVSVTMFFYVNSYTFKYILVHLAVFLPISYIVAKLKVSLLPIVIGFLLTGSVIQIGYRVFQIYIL
jgi:putative tricarboxylic transport membrane protein